MSHLEALPLERSTKGRRPPLYALTYPGRHFDDDDVSLEELEVANDVLLGVVDRGDQSWENEHEAVIAWFYDPTSPCLVGGSFPDDMSSHLDEMAFACRARGEQVIASDAATLSLSLNGNGRIKLQKEGFEPWLKRTDSERKQIVLTTLANSARAEEVENSRLVARYRKLVPEIQVKKLCSDGGMGLVRLFEYIAPYVLDASNLSTNPVYNEDFFRKFGITRSPNQLPLSLASRAFQQEYLLKRHSLLFRFCHLLILALESQVIPRVQTQRSDTLSCRVGTFRSEITATNCAEVADSLSDSPNSHPASRFGDCAEERCSTCFEKGGTKEVPKLLYCGRCKKVGRIEPYCSESCQREDWRRHKKIGFCGTKLSTCSTIPIINSTPSHPLRLYFLNSLVKTPEAFWFIQDQGASADFAMRCNGDVTGIDQAMRKISLKALRDQDPPSIDLLAFALIENDKTPSRLKGELGDDGSMSAATSSQNVENEVPSYEHRKSQFRQIFDLLDDKRWKECVARGKLAIETPENLLVKAYYVMNREYPPGQTEEERKDWLLHEALTSTQWTNPVDQLKAMIDVELLAPLSFR